MLAIHISNILSKNNVKESLNDVFKFMKDNKELGLVTKKWSGLGKEMFTSADNYILEIKDVVEKTSSVRLLILAAVICIDMVIKE